jgi:hypothetical protein
LASSDADPSPSRRRVGELLAERRAQIHPRYSVREAFIRERGRGISPATFADIETRGRARFEPATVLALEFIYELPPGWLGAALNGDVRPLPPPGRPSLAAAAATLRSLLDAELPEEYLDALEREIVAADMPADARLRIWETLKAIRAAREEGRTPREAQAG